MQLLKQLLIIIESSDDSIWSKLISYKQSLNSNDSCEITAQDEKMLKNDIESKIKAGWDETEIFNYLKWSEYFDDYTHDEDECIKNMKFIKSKVENRLNSLNKG